MVEASFGRLRSKERHVQGQPLRPRQVGECFVAEAPQEVCKADIRELGFGLRRSGGSDLMPLVRGSCDAGLPQGGLADSRLPPKHERSIRAGTLDEVVDRGELRVAPHDPIGDHVSAPHP